MFPQSFSMDLCVQLSGNRLFLQSAVPKNQKEHPQAPAAVPFLRFRFISPLTGPHGRRGPDKEEHAKAFPSRSPRPASGDHSAVEPPVPIPNTEVKRRSANGSRTTGPARVGRCQK